MEREVKSDAAVVRDQRSTRWDHHRAQRRADLIDAAVTAIDEHGPAASIADIALVAGVSKPVLYRYFADKDDLYRAVGTWGADQVLEVVRAALRSPAPVRQRVTLACEGYFRLIATHPNVFLLLVEHRSSNDALKDGKEQIAASFARRLGDAFRTLGLDAAAAEPWAHGLVGFGMAHGEWWVRRRTMSQKSAAHYLAEFIWHAIEGIATEAGVDLANLGTLTAVPRIGETK